MPALNTVLALIEQTLDSMDAQVADEITGLFEGYVNHVGEYVKTFSVNAIKLISGSLSEIPGFIIKLVVMIISTFSL